MATKIRPVLSKKNKYWIGKHRYYELKHFCLQYAEWKKAYSAIDGLSKKPCNLPNIQKDYSHSDPTAKYAVAKAMYAEKIEMVERTAMDADPELHTYILKAVTEDLTYETLQASYEIPCSRSTYYDRYRKFFWILNNARN